MKLYELIAALVQYGIDTGLTPACESTLPIFYWTSSTKTITKNQTPSLLFPWKRFWKDFSTKPADGN